MGLQVKQRWYVDHLGRTIGFPVGNQGDKGVYVVEYSCFFGTYATQNSPIQVIGGGDTTIQLSQGTWEELGITSGDTIIIDLQNDEGDLVLIGSTTVLIVEGNELRIDFSYSYSFTSFNGFVYSNKTPQSVETLFNLIPHDQNDGMESFIDSSITKLRYNNLASLNPSNSAPMTLVGNVSGSIINSAVISRLNNETDPISGGNILIYQISISFQWYGYLSAFLQDYFFDGKTVTPIVKTSIFPQFNNMGILLSNTFKLQNDGNSGFRDENFNQGVDNFTVDSFVWRDVNSNPIGAFDYQNPSRFEFQVTSLAGFGNNFGLIFFNDVQDLDTISANTDNNNGDFNHARHTILAEVATLTATTGQSFNSVLGVNGEQLSFSEINISVAGNIATVTGLITPNSQFADKFSEPDYLEKNFAFLFRCETSSFGANNYSTTVNSTLWTGQGEVAPIILGQFDGGRTIYDHLRNQLYFKEEYAIIEDDNRVQYGAMLNKNEQYTGIRFSNIVINNVTSDFFVLESYTFDIDNTIQMDGSQNISVNIPVYFNQPQLAQNSRFLAVRNSAQDTPSQYRVDLSFPFLQRWEYWQPQSGVDIQFYNVANKDWLNYNLIGDWQLATRTELITPVGNYVNDWKYGIQGYDHNPNLSHVWEFERLDSTPITTPLLGEVILIRSKWTSLTVPFVQYDQHTGWGNITVEPFEGQPRPVISSVYQQGNQPQNPLIPINGSGDMLSVTGWGTNELVFECLFDPNRINTNTGVSLTSRVNNGGELNLLDSLNDRTKKHFQLVQLPIVPEDSGKNTICCDCTPSLVLASATENDLFKNDITSVFHKLDDVADTCDFKIYKNGVLLPNYGVVSTFPKDNGLQGFSFNWRDYLINHQGGCYTIVKEITAAGILFEIELGHYQLMPFNNDTSENTVRVIGHYSKEVQWNENGALKRANFTDSNFETSMRFKGYFGGWQPNPQVINHYAWNGMLRNAKIRYKGTYGLVMAATTICHYESLVKELLLFSSILKCSDYNFTNPNQKQEVIWTVMNDENSIDVEYYEDSRKASVVVGLKDMFNNEVSRFDGSINPLNGVTYQLATIGTSGTGGVCTPANVEAKNSNGLTVDSDTFASGSSGILNAPDGTVIVKTVSNVVVGTVSVPSGESEDFIIADPNSVDIYINQEFILTALSPSHDFYLKNSANQGVQLQGVSGNDLYLPDTIINIIVNGNLQDTVNVPNGAIETINII